MPAKNILNKLSDTGIKKTQRSLLKHCKPQLRRPKPMPLDPKDGSMAVELQLLLPQLVLEAVAWAKTQAQYVAESGKPLTEPGLALARQVGVRNPEQVRLLYVDQLPLPIEELLLRQAVDEMGLFGPNTAGLTLDHSIMIVHGHADARLVSHELRHVHQYEELGGIDGFMPIYLEQIASAGYERAPLEIDARRHEIRAPNKVWA